jgi:hypothetical protein
MPRVLDIDAPELEQGGAAGAALLAGRLVATVVSGKTGAHVTVQGRAKAKQDGRWRLTPFAEATHVFLDTPAPDGPGTKIGTYYPTGKRAGKLWTDSTVDPAREWAADYVLRWAAGRPVNGGATVLLGTNCLACGRELTDPVSIEANVGPECRKKLGMNGENGHHHARGETFAEDVDSLTLAEQATLRVEVAHLSDPPAFSAPETGQTGSDPGPEVEAPQAPVGERSEGSAPDDLYVLRPGDDPRDALRGEGEGP